MIEQSRFARWGWVSCAALAMAAGTAMGQQDHGAGTTQTMKDQSKDHADKENADNKDQASKETKEQGWKSAQSLPGVRHDVVLAGKTKNDKDVNVVFSGGRLASAELDNQSISKDRVQMKEDKVRVVDENKQELVCFKLPQQILGMGGDQGIDRDRFDQDRSDSRFEQDRWDTRQDRFTTTDRFETRRYDTEPVQRSNERSEWEARSQTRWDVQGDDRFEVRDRWDSPSQYRTDRYDTMRSQPDRFPTRDRSSDTRMEYRTDRDWSDREFEMRSDRYQPYGTTEHRARTEADDPWMHGQYHSQSTYRSDQDGSFRPSRSEQDFSGRSTSRYQTQGRIYGSAQDRPIVLGIIMDDVDSGSISTTGTRYDRGVRVERIREGGAADVAGLREGDVIVLVDRQPASTQIIERRLSGVRDGDDLRLTVIRDGRERDVNVRLMSATEYRESWETPEGTPELPEMPNVSHPGPYNLYRPTQPSDAAPYERDTTFRTRDFDRPRNAEMRTRTYRTDDFDARFDDRDYEVRYDPRRDYDVRYETRDRDLDVRFERDRDLRFRDRDVDAYYRPSRTFHTTEFDAGSGDWGPEGEHPEMPNVEHPGPYNLYRPMRPEMGRNDPAPRTWQYREYRTYDRNP